MKRQEVSIADIARSAGVSHTTVSRALRESPLISPDTRGRIQRIAREMGYTPNALAQGLQTQRTSTIGLVVTTIADPFFSDVVKGVEGVAREAGFSVLFGASHNEPEQEMVVIDTFHRRRVDGILIASSRVTNYEQRLDHVKVPTVLINSPGHSQHKLLYRVAVDDYQGAQCAVEHLLHLGHRAIGYLGIRSRPISNQQRLSGYHKALEAAGIDLKDEWVMIAPNEEASSEADVAAGQQLLPRLFDAGVTAVFCYNDMMAIGGLMACRERGIAVPEALSLVGFDDVSAASYVAPQLTTIRQPREQLGELAMQVMLDLLDNHPGRDHILQPQLIVRRSTTPRAASTQS